ncbi:MAG: hypothetical protein ACRC68_02715, partial [Clostridium sp.]
ERLSRQTENADDVLNLMKNNNPSVIPRNYRVEEALEEAVTKGDYNSLEKLIEVISNPYSYSQDQEEYKNTIKEKVPYRTFCGT